MAVFSEAFLRLRQDFDQGHQKRKNLIREIRTEVRALARQTGDQLAEQGRTRRAEFAAMLQGLRGKIQEQAAQTRQQLSEVASDLRRGGEIFGRTRPARRALHK